MISEVVVERIGADGDGVATLPDGSSGIVWRATQGAGVTAGGGWNPNFDPGNYFRIDPTKSYLFACYFKKVSASGTPSAYFGLNLSSNCPVNTTTQPGGYNPYFGATGLTAGRWYLFVGWVFPAGSTGNVTGKAGVYDCTTGALAATALNFNWMPGAARCSTQAYQYYGAAGDVEYIARPQAYLCDGSEPSVDYLLNTGALAEAAASAAQAAADAANAELANIASDSLLSPVEKPAVILDWQNIANADSGIQAQATALGITTELTAYQAAASALTTYLATLTTPVLWSDTSGNTTIVGTTFRTKFEDLYSTRQVLLNKIAQVASTLATWSGVSGVSVTTGQIAAGAATAIDQDDYDFAGGGFGTISVRTFTVTPSVNCNVEVSAVITANNILPDSNNKLEWTVTPAGGGASTFLYGNSDSVSRQTFAGSTSFAATGGVTLTFELKTTKSGATIHLFKSQLRVTQVKR